MTRVLAPEVRAARDLSRTRAMPVHMLTDGEIGNEARDGGTTAGRLAALQAEAAERRSVRAAMRDEAAHEALERMIRARIGAPAGGDAP